jgi:hypothetical protein
LRWRDRLYRRLVIIGASILGATAPATLTARTSDPAATTKPNQASRYSERSLWRASLLEIAYVGVLLFVSFVLCGMAARLVLGSGQWSFAALGVFTVACVVLWHGLMVMLVR